MFRVLIWKQWREQRWRVALSAVVLTGFTGISLRSRIMGDEGSILTSIALGAVLMPIFMAMGLIAPSREDGSHDTALALPVRPWALAAVTVTVGAAGVLGPLAASALTALLIAGGRQMSASMILQVYAAGGALGVLLTYWVLVITARWRSEGLVGVAGCAALLVWLAWLAALNLAEPEGRWTPVFLTGNPLAMVVWVGRAPAEERFALPQIVALALNVMILAAAWRPLVRGLGQGRLR